MDQNIVSHNSYTFNPPFWMRPAMAQTILASRKFRKKAASYVVEHAKSMILDCTDGVRLKASFTSHPNSKGVFIFLHGWEGSEDSTYVLSCSRFIYEAGYSVFRLNFRDHGDTHHLNEGLFHSVLFQEVLDGVTQGANLRPDEPAYIVGFSLGGNFALRVARAQKENPIPNLKHIFSISPVIDPVGSSAVIDINPLIRRYFLKKWTTSLEKKQAAHPEIYDFSHLISETSVVELTRKFLAEYSEFDSPQHYFSSYAINENDLSDCPVPTSIIMAVDDPVLIANDVMTINLSSCVRRIMLKYGGHNGFFQSLYGPTWYDDYIAKVLKV